MLAFLLVLLAVVAALIAVMRRLANLERLAAQQEQVLRRALERIYELEQAARPTPATPRPSVPVTGSEPAPRVEAVPDFMVATLAPEASRDWEAIIGGNWLNKIGALVLVVGIGLFLAFSLTRLGPAGKVGIGLAAGLSMLAAGVALDRSARYRMFARGFLGGGWAAIFFTTYAMHAFPAAKVVDDPILATALLLGVSLLMVVHSLLYRTEPVTVLAYFISFAALNITPPAGFTVVAALLLAISLMVTAYRFTWSRLAVAGVVFAYGTFALTYEPGLYGRSGILNGQSILWIYWLVFEAYDLVDLRRRGVRDRLERTLFLLNAAGFVGSSVLHEWNMGTQGWALYFALAALAYLASAMLRARLRPSTADLPVSERIVSGGYEGAAAATSLLAAAAIVERFSGLQVSVGLLLEAQIVVLAGLALKDRFLLGLGAALFAPALLRLTVDAFNGERWTSVAGAAALVFYFNHLLLRSGWVYPAAGSVLLFAVSAKEVPDSWLGAVWGAALVGVAALSRRIGRTDLRWQAYGLAAVLALWTVANTKYITSAALAAASLFGAYLLLRTARLLVPLATLVTAALLEQQIPTGLVTVSWGMLAAVLVAGGFVLRDRPLRLAGLSMMLLCVGRLFLWDLRQLDTMARILSFVLLGLILLGASWVYTRFREQIQKYL